MLRRTNARRRGQGHSALATPPAYIGILQGITRDTVIALAQDMGLTGTAAEVIPAVQFDGRTIDVPLN